MRYRDIMEEVNPPTEELSDEEFDRQQSEFVASAAARLKQKTNRPDVRAWIDNAVAQKLRIYFGAKPERVEEIMAKFEALIEQVNALDHPIQKTANVDDVRDALVARTKNPVQHGPRKINVESPQFKAWFGDSKVVDSFGNPLVVFRGGTRDSGDREFESRLGLPSFVASGDIASIYASTRDVLGMSSFKPGAYVALCFLAIENPLYLTEETLSLEALAESVNYDWDSEYDTEYLLALVNDLREREEDGNLPNFHYELPAGLIGQVDWEEFHDRLARCVRKKDWERLNYLLAETEIDSFVFADSPIFVDWARLKGFDGIIHTDVFDLGQKMAPKLLGKPGDQLHGMSEYGTHLTYRPFTANQVKSAFNRGTWDKNANSMNEAL